MASETVNIPPTGVTAELYRAAIGPRGQDYYLRQFARFDANGRTGASWHWPAYWATLNWLIYRRMWGWALAYVASLLGLGLVIFGVGKLVFSYSDTTGLLLFMVFLTAAFVLPGLYANAWFYTYCNEKISAALRSTSEIKDACEVLRSEASTNTRWLTLASVNVAMMALLAGLVTFVLNPGTDGQQLAQSRQVRGTADQMIVVPQPVLAAANVAMPEPQPAVLPAVPATPPLAAASTSGDLAAQPAISAKMDDAAAKPAAEVAQAAPVVVPAAPELPKPVLVAAATAEETPADTSEAKPVAVKKRAAARPKVKHTWLVQVGAFAQESNAQNVRAKVEEIGLQTSAEPADTPAGRLTRVRVGPFETKDAADKAAMRLKALDLPTVLIRQ
jgi:cell division septation protein DedD